MGTPKLISVALVSDYKLELEFSDGLKAKVDFSKELFGGVFDKLQDLQYFASFKFQPQFGTIEWDNGADFAPEFLYQAAQKSV